MCVDSHESDCSAPSRARNLNLSYGNLKRILSGRLYSAISMIDKHLAAFSRKGSPSTSGRATSGSNRTARASRRSRSTTTERTSWRTCQRQRPDRVLSDLEANGQAALVFGRPTDDRACQVKGVFTARARRRRTSARW